MGENYFNWRQRVKERAQELSQDTLEAESNFNDSLLQDQYFNQDLSADEAARQFYQNYMPHK